MSGACRFSHTLRDIDHALGLTKGHAFRAFKSLLDTLREGQDFAVLDHRRDAARIKALREAGRIYPASINAVVVSGDARRRVEQCLQQPD